MMDDLSLKDPRGFEEALFALPAEGLGPPNSALGRTRLRTFITLRWLAIALCCVLLFQPAFETTTYRRTQNQVHVLVDDSASMQRKDRYPEPEQQAALQELVGDTVATKTRQDLTRAVLERPAGLLEALRKTHDVRLFRMQRKPVPIRSLDELTARGNRTTLGDALDLHMATIAGSNVDAVVLVSDGRNNGGNQEFLFQTLLLRP